MTKSAYDFVGLLSGEMRACLKIRRVLCVDRIALAKTLQGNILKPLDFLLPIDLSRFWGGGGRSLGGAQSLLGSPSGLMLQTHVESSRTF